MSPSARTPAPALSVILPAFNEQDGVVPTLTALTRVLHAAELPSEIIVVSDGSTDQTVDRARAFASQNSAVRIIEYFPNRGKGHALRVGSTAAQGAWIAWLDADLDLDPAALPAMLDFACTQGLDALIGSKRHPQSVVDYPLSRRVGSRLYQGLNRALFALDVTDTQVGLKMFRREVLETALPRVFVKRYAFDLEVLAVANAYGFRSMSEYPVVLTYRFSGSGMNWTAISRALWDTAAVFYRLRIRRSYGAAPRRRSDAT